MSAVSPESSAVLPAAHTLDALHALAYPIDTHLDSLYLSRLVGCDFWKGDWKANRRSLIIWLINKTSPRGRNQPLMYHVSDPDFLAGGYGGACFSAHALWENLIAVPFLDPWKNWVDHQRYVEAVVAASEGRMRLARSAAEVRAIRAEGLCCAILSLEGAHMLGPRGISSQALRLKRLEIAAKAGAAYLTLNHFSHTDISQAGYAPLNPWRSIEGGGLSEFGKEVVERCIDVGLLLDLSHTSGQGIIDACGICTRRNVPAFASHGASRSVTRGAETRPSRHLDRGLDDQAIRAIVQTGGCISVILAPYFLQHSYLADGKPNMDADLAFVIRYYEAFARQITDMGIVADPWKYLSFGSDFDGGISSLPMDMRSGADLPKLTQAMIDAGWPAQRIVDVYSGNFLRVWERVRP
ncbi:membrane dipeptidase [Xanthomonas fragariae]|uniref:membrane dipeptidase n=1 Tax=Xanthomonas fragariae TaxID=48664 RepID=UPI000A35D1DE|nr:membrane dipeptidase [Xanthomonas fragariae]SMQ94385.1 peptidase [Xanthomonas fragariae]